MTIPKTTLAAALILAGSAVAFDVPADAQGVASRQRDQQQREQRRGRGEQGEEQGQQRAAGQIQNLSREENAAIVPVYQAVQASDWPTATTALPAAQAAAQSPYARYVVAQLQLQIGRGTNNTQMQSQAVDAMIASGGAPAEAMTPLLGAQADFAIQARNYAAAEAPLTRLIEADANNVQLLNTLAQVKLRLNKRDEAIALTRRVMELSQASGQPAPEASYRQVLAIAYEGRQGAAAVTAARDLIRAYPTQTNWRDGLMIYRELGGVDSALEIDVRRLMRAAGALTSEADYVLLAEATSRGGLPGETKAVLDEGVSRGVLRAGGPHAQLLTAANAAVADDRAGLAGQRAAATSAPDARRAVGLADAYASYGQYAEAATLYRAALTKSGADTNLINLRLGAALAQSGQRAEAETALRAVTGPRAEIANFWLLWLERRPAA